MYTQQNLTAIIKKKWRVKLEKKPQVHRRQLVVESSQPKFTTAYNRLIAY